MKIKYWQTKKFSPGNKIRSDSTTLKNSDPTKHFQIKQQIKLQTDRPAKCCIKTWRSYIATKAQVTNNTKTTKLTGKEWWNTNCVSQMTFIIFWQNTPCTYDRTRFREQQSKLHCKKSTCNSFSNALMVWNGEENIRYRRNTWQSSHRSQSLSAGRGRIRNWSPGSDTTAKIRCMPLVLPNKLSF